MSLHNLLAEYDPFAATVAVDVPLTSSTTEAPVPAQTKVTTPTDTAVSAHVQAAESLLTEVPPASAQIKDATPENQTAQSEDQKQKLPEAVSVGQSGAVTGADAAVLPQPLASPDASSDSIVPRQQADTDTVTSSADISVEHDVECVPAADASHDYLHDANILCRVTNHRFLVLYFHTYFTLCFL